jgi:hypothetical protein
MPFRSLQKAQAYDDDRPIGAEDLCSVSVVTAQGTGAFVTIHMDAMHQQVEGRPD